MYTTYYKLKKTPFNQSIDPKFIWLSEKQAKALAAFKQDYFDKKGIFLITGDAGTGKTAFIKKLLAETESETIVATVTDPDLNKLDFFNWLSVEFNMDVMFKSKGAFLTRFKRFLLEAHQENQNVTLIIDDAHRINQELVDEILTLSNIEKAGDKLMSIFIAGQIEFNKILQNNQNSALKQTINAHFDLKPLKEGEVVQLIQYRLKVAGAKAEIFSPRAYHEIYQFSAGYPRMVVNICDRAMIAGCISATDVIDKNMIIGCGKDLQIAGIEKEVTGLNYLDEIPGSKTSEPDEIKEKNKEIKKSFFDDLRVRIAPLARTAMLSAFLVMLGIIAIYFVYHFKSVLLSWASFTPDQENSILVQNDSAALNVTPKIEKEFEINKQLTAVEEKKLLQTEVTSTEFSNDGYVLDELNFDEKNISSDAISPPAADELETKSTVVNDFSDAGDDTQPLQIKSDIETIAPIVSELKVAEISPGKADPETEQSPIVSSENETERESAEREFKMLSRRLALKLKLAEPERQEIGIQEVYLEPKIGIVPDAEPAHDSEPRKGVHPSKLVDKKLYLAEKERPEADFRIIHVVTKTEKISDALPTDNPESRENDILSQPVAKILDPPANKPLEVDTRVVRAEPKIDKIIGTQLEDNSKVRPNIQPQQSAIKNRPIETPSAKSDLDPISKPQQQPDTQIAALEQADKEDGLRIRQHLQDRLNSFLEIYCQTYEAKDLDHFASFFAPDAKENDKPFHNLLPKYRHNFNVIEFINYRIELQKYNYNDQSGAINIEGRFFLEWLPGGTKWRRNSGKIFMELHESGTSFEISRLDYFGDQRKNNK
jgi:type II secretory pathway predicted ATPase ExeA